MATDFAAQTAAQIRCLVDSSLGTIEREVAAKRSRWIAEECLALYR